MFLVCRLAPAGVRVAFRKKLCRNLEELQADLDEWLKQYNESRPHSWKYCRGKTPPQTFLDSRQLAAEKMHDRLAQPTSPDNVADTAAALASLFRA